MKYSEFLQHVDSLEDSDIGVSHVLDPDWFTNQTSENCLRAVRRDGYNLQYIKDQTPEICMAAVKKEGRALQYVREQTPEMCLAAVKRDE